MTATIEMEAGTAPASTFLTRHFGNLGFDETINIRTIKTGGGAQNFFFPTVEHAAEALDGAAKKLNVYFGVNPRRGQDGSKAGVSRIVCLHADVDDKAFDSTKDALRSLESFDLTPSSIVRSGNGFHAYWRLSETLEATPNNIAYAESLMLRLYHAIGQGNLDGVQDVSRILRVPGTINHKNGAEVKLVLDSDDTYQLSQFEAILPLLPKRTPRIMTGRDMLTPDEQTVERMLKHVDPTLPYDEWLSILMSVHSIYPDERGLRLVDEWSTDARRAGDQQTVTDSKWQGFRRSGYGVGTLIHYAVQGGWVQPESRVIVGGKVAKPLTEKERNRLRPWQVTLQEYPEPAVSELPPLLRKLVEHIEPLAAAFDADWNQSCSLAFASSLFPRMHFENLNLAIWWLGLNGQGVGKNVVSDELLKVFQKAAEDRGEPLPLFTSGSAEGMVQRLKGDNVTMLGYFREYMGFMKSLKREGAGAVRETMCNIYDGAPVSHQLAGGQVEVNDPYAIVIGTTTPTAFGGNGDREDLNNGYLSRFMFCACDARDVMPPRFDMRDSRNRLAEELNDAVRRTANVRYARFDTPGGTTPPCLVDYMAALGINTGRVRNLDDEYGSDNLPAGRLIARVKKVAAVIELAEDAPLIVPGNAEGEGETLMVTERNVALAIRFVQRAQAYGQRASRWLTRGKEEGTVEKIEKVLQKHKEGMTARELQQQCHANKKEIETALTLLISDGTVTRFTAGKREVFRCVEV